MAAFLALGLLLMAGAYLNLRFRQRLMPAPCPTPRREAASRRPRPCPARRAGGGRVSRSIEVAAPGRATIVLDRDVYEHAREDLGDLRMPTTGRRPRICSCTTIRAPR